MRQVTGINWGEVGRLVKKEGQPKFSYSKLKKKIHDRGRAYRQVLLRLFSPTKIAYLCASCDGPVVASNVTSKGFAAALLLCCFQLCHIDCHRKLFIQSFALVGTAFSSCGTIWHDAELGSEMCTPQAVAMRRQKFHLLENEDFMSQFYLENEPPYWELENDNVKNLVETLSKESPQVIV